MKKIRLIELFAGIGSQRMALKNIGADFESWIISEWEFHSNFSYKEIFHETDTQNYSKPLSREEVENKLYLLGISSDGKKPMTHRQIKRIGENKQRELYNAFIANNNIGNIVNIKGEDLHIVDTNKYTYILTYSFPCQDLSAAGKREGMTKGSGTRSGLLWEVERLLDESTELPQILIMENVPQVHSKKNYPDFNKWIECLQNHGYVSYWQDLNAKDYSIPQNRKRCFMVSFLDDKLFMFPQPQKLELKLKDLLEKNVSDKFYLNRKFTSIPIKNKELIQVGNINISNNESNNRVYSPEGLCPTVNTAQGGHRQPKIIEPFICTSRDSEFNNLNNENINICTKQNLELNMSDCNNCSTIVQKDNYVIKPINPMPDGTCRTIKTQYHKTSKANFTRSSTFGATGVIKIEAPIKSGKYATSDTYRIRKLTPKECWRLMGFRDEDFYKAEKVNSNTQLYKQAGNSIVVQVLEAIFKNIIHSIM